MAVGRNKGKKSLKEPDEFITFSSRLLQQVIEHKNKIIGALAGIVVLALVITAASYFSEKAAKKSLLMLSQAVARYETVQSDSGDVAAYEETKDDLQQIIDAYGGSIGGKLANLFLADCSFSAGEYESSATLYRKAVSDFKDAYPFETLAKSSLGYALSEQGDHDAARQVFESMTEGESSLMGDEALFALARQYAATGKTELQKETARKLMESYPDSIYTNIITEEFPALATSAG